LQFKLRLAGHLKKTLAEIDQMDSREFSTWIACSRWFFPLDDSWGQMAMLATSILAPYSKTPPDPEKFIPREDRAPKHPTQIQETLKRMALDLGTK
jgi:hypothetical protein